MDETRNENTNPGNGVGLESIRQLDECQVVRSEFMSPLLRAKMTINFDSISFSASCLRLFSNVEFVQILMYVEKRKLVILPCDKFAKDSYKWCNYKGDKPVPRTSKCKIFCAKLYDLMGWIPENRYKVQAIYQNLDGRELLVFNLDECEMVVPEYVQTEDGKTITKRKRYYPEAWKDSFGMTYKEHAQSIKIDIDAHYMLSNANDGSESDFRITQREIQGAELKPSSVITRLYNTPDDNPQEY